MQRAGADLLIGNVFQCSCAGRGVKGAFAPGGTVQGAALGGAIWNSEILHSQLSVLFTVHTNAIVVTIRITIGDLIAGLGAATKTFATGGKHPRAATVTMQQ